MSVISTRIKERLIPVLAEIVYDYLLTKNLATITAIDLVGNKDNDGFQQFIKYLEPRDLITVDLVYNSVKYARFTQNYSLDIWCCKYFVDNKYKSIISYDYITLLPSTQQLDHLLRDWTAEDLKKLTEPQDDHSFIRAIQDNAELRLLVIDRMKSKGIESPPSYARFQEQAPVEELLKSISLSENLYLLHHSLQYWTYDMAYKRAVRDIELDIQNVLTFSICEPFVEPLSVVTEMLQLYFDFPIKQCRMGHSYRLKDIECPICPILDTFLVGLTTREKCTTDNGRRRYCSRPILEGWHQCFECFNINGGCRSEWLTQIHHIQQPKLTLCIDGSMIINTVLYGLVFDRNGTPVSWGLPQHDKVRVPISDTDMIQIQRLLREYF